jgi:hypothetical protein
MKYKTTDPEIIQKIYNNHYTKGKGRTVKDIKNIITKLDQVGLLQEKNQRIINKLRENGRDTIKGESKDELIFLLKSVEKKGLVITPFLQAIKENEGKKTKTIIEATQNNLVREGIEVKIGSDSCAAMKNLLAYLQILTNGRGKYQLTALGESISYYLVTNDGKSNKSNNLLLNMYILGAIEYLTQSEKKSSTYKIALTLGIIDYIIENPSELPKNASHHIPIINIAQRWFYYYYPMIHYEEVGVKQGPTQVAIMKKLQVFFSENNKITSKEALEKHFFEIREMIENNEPLPVDFIKLLKEIRTIILAQPLRYIKMGDTFSGSSNKKMQFKLTNTNFTVFGLVNNELNSLATYDDVRKQGKKWKIKKEPMTWHELISSENTFIQMGRFTYLEFVKLRFAIKDKLILDWIKTTQSFKVKKDELNHLIYALHLHKKPALERDSRMMTALRKIVKNRFQEVNCLYCDEDISKKFDLDHLIPWSKLPINYFYNLFPACSSCNSTKSDKIIEIDDNLLQKLKKYLMEWLNVFYDDDEKMIKFGGNLVEQILLLLKEEDKATKDKLADLLIDRVQDLNSKVI